jgi:glycosyltransferase involved in cell wall biosynthesis
VLSVTYSFRDDLAARGIDPGKIDVVTNGVDTGQFSPEHATFDARAALGVPPGATLAGYIGTVGMAHGLETILDAAALVRGRGDVRFLIIGDGAERGAWRPRPSAGASTTSCSGTSFRASTSPAISPRSTRRSSTLRPDPVFRTVIPSKIFESMAMGVPIVMAVEGESAEIVRTAGAGVCIPSGHPEAMVEAVTGLGGGSGRAPPARCQRPMRRSARPMAGAHWPWRPSIA